MSVAFQNWVNRAGRNPRAERRRRIWRWVVGLFVFFAIVAATTYVVRLVWSLR